MHIGDLLHCCPTPPPAVVGSYCRSIGAGLFDPPLPPVSVRGAAATTFYLLAILFNVHLTSKLSVPAARSEVREGSRSGKREAEATICSLHRKRKRRRGNEGADERTWSGGGGREEQSSPHLARPLREIGRSGLRSIYPTDPERLSGLRVTCSLPHRLRAKKSREVRCRLKRPSATE